MIKRKRYKLWQILAQWSTNFWRHFGNMYSQKLIWYCDKCKKKIKETRYEYMDYQYCENCYKNRNE